MNSNDKFCSKHGPYPASYPSCPYCAQDMGGRPPAPMSLDDEETYGGGVPPFRSGFSDNDETLIPGQGRPYPNPASGFPGSAGNDETILPGQGQGRMDEDDSTVLPERKRRILDFDEEDDIEQTVIDRDDTSIMGWLIVKKSRYMRRGQIFKIRPGIILGRHPRQAHILIDDEKISSMHARIQIKNDQFIVIDLGSTNGTRVNGEEITAATVIQQDDLIELGDSILVLKTLMD